MTSLTDLLTAQAGIRPDDIAVEYGDELLSFRGLLDRAADLASCLRGLGVGRDDCVGVFLEPSTALPVGVWGVLFAGGAYLPLSPDYPDERIRAMAEDSRAKVLLTDESLRARLAELAPPGTRIITPADVTVGPRPAGDPSDRLTASPAPGDLAYVIYTSGSTGRPKGVMVEHRSIVHQMLWLGRAYGLGPADTVLQKTPISFDAAQWEILAPCVGSRIVLSAPGAYRDPEGLVDTVVRHGVTTVQCVPTLLQALLDTDRLPECASLTQVFCGGEALPRRLAQRFVETLEKCELINLYGPTECTINASAFTVDPATVADGPPGIPIGAPVDGTVFHVLDERMAPVAPGSIGELYISGVQVARGYLHRPDLTAERFVPNPFSDHPAHATLYRTGDLVHETDDSRFRFAGRADRQVKLRGYRVELDEIRLAIEAHDWVRNAAVLVKDDPATGYQNLVACIELSPREAVLMDQGNHDPHHVSKASRFQVRAQLADGGCRDAADLATRPFVELPGRTPTPEQRRRVFARKTYRFYEGGEIRPSDLLALLGRRVRGTGARLPSALDLTELGEILRYFGQYPSDDRLLPKYGYASPGSLYATQLYLEVGHGIRGLAPGYWYYHPVHHRLVLIEAKQVPGRAGLRFHFVGRRRAIEPVYRNNVQEVLEIEAGHMVGLLEEVLPAHGLDLAPAPYAPAEKRHLHCAAEDHYLGAFELVPFRADRPDVPVDVYVQVHPGRIRGLAAGQYRYADGMLQRISDELVLKRHVIAINQQVYERAALGITVVSPAPVGWRSYLDLGRKLQQLQMNDSAFGFMAAGYSSRTGNDLPAAKRMADVLSDGGHPTGPSYFFVGGRVSEEQLAHEGMREDSVHMQGPAEMIRADLVDRLPDYMVPNRLVVMDRLPLTSNGKIDVRALEASPETDFAPADRPFVAPRTTTERIIRELWQSRMGQQAASVRDDFFERGGNSLIAVGLVNQINRQFGCSLPLQVLFESPTIEELARRVDGQRGASTSRLVPLGAARSGRPVYCWPGLGGYPMNLRPLALRLGPERPFFGIQARGVNAGEHPCATIAEMAAEDVRVIRDLQPEGPYTLWGYSFGARVAFETAHLLEQAGEQVDQLLLIAPGQPKLRTTGGGRACYTDPGYLTILFSVFAGTVTGPALDECLRATGDEESFVSYIVEHFDGLDRELVARITTIVRQTYEFTYNFAELRTRRIHAPVTILKADGDDYSFIESSSGYSAVGPQVVNLTADHYGMLREPGVEELAGVIAARLGTGRPGADRRDTPAAH
ncbi:amino acid adenylation domain-containing protein [Kitasatospora sp. NPDC051914]|uniref:amino acid adenylation domain-containing protein n=1 Tax=Kitasatospora sp. NPDC051914 TaxID=3154945 RepID=UPI0034266293